MNIAVISGFTYFSHTIIGSIAFIGGITALSTKKGSKIHKTGGWIFFFGMLYAALSIIEFMIEELRPLAILLSVATIYFMVTSITALRHQKKYSKLVDTIFIIFPILMFAFTTLMFVAILPEISFGTLARFLFSFTFGLMLIRDIKRLRKMSKDHLFFIKRHAFRMIIAFGFAIMAVLRVGIKIDVIDLELTVVIPMLFALLFGFYIERNIEKWL